MRRPRKERSAKKLRRNPALGFDLSTILDHGVGDMLVLTALCGANFVEKAMVSSVIPGFLSIMRNKGKFGPNEHWEAFKPHCPQICGVPCPPACENSKEAHFDGCHICDCLRGKKGARGKQPQVASPSGAAKKRKTR